MSDTEKSAQAQPNESAEPSFRYNAKLAQGIEEKWQKIWDDEGAFWAANVNGDLKDGKGHNAEGRPSYFAMDMFPYPSGKGLHVGHPLGYLATDVVSRYHRMKGENVLHAMGYDAFGLPAEQYAVQTGQHPRITTEQNIANMRRQLHRMGLSFDNRRSFATIDPGYVRWTQWIFSRIYDAWYDKDATNPSGSKGCARPISTLVEQFESGKRAIPGFEGKAWADLSEAEQADVLNDFRLAYISKSPVNWCPGLGTVLANEEVTAEGKSERGNFPVFQRELRQWSMRITAYGHRLIEDLDTIDWPEKVKLMQRNWIGESHGASVHFDVETPNGVKDMEIYTTRPDTLFGTTFAVVSPEHHLLENVPEEWPAETPEDWKGGYATPVEAVWPPKPRPPRTAWTRRARRPACSPACTPSTRSPALSCRCSPPTTCSWTTAPARSWQCRAAISAITISPSSSACRSSTPSSRCRNPATTSPTMRARRRSSPMTASSSTPLSTRPRPRAIP